MAQAVACVSASNLPVMKERARSDGSVSIELDDGERYRTLKRISENQYQDVLSVGLTKCSADPRRVALKNETTKL